MSTRELPRQRNHGYDDADNQTRRDERKAAKRRRLEGTPWQDRAAERESRYGG
jgi:hypothetical protein